MLRNPFSFNYFWHSINKHHQSYFHNLLHLNLSLSSIPDEKEKYDPNGFRDALVQGLERAGGDLDAAYKFLDSAGSKLDYRRYGEVIFDVLIAGGLLREYHTFNMI